MGENATVSTGVDTPQVNESQNVVTDTVDNTVVDNSTSIETNPQQNIDVIDKVDEVKKDTVEEPKTTELTEPTEPKTEDKVDETFKAEEVDFEAMTPYDDVNGYNLTPLAQKYGIDTSDNEALEEVKGYTEKLKKANFSQEQAELFFQSHLDKIIEEQNIENEQYNPKNVQKVLNENLTIEEKRNYKSILNWINQANQKDGISHEMINDAMANPNLIKFLNVLYKSTTSKTPQEIPKPVVKGGISATTAVDRYKNWIQGQNNVTPEQTKEFLLGLQNELSQESINDFNKIFKSFLQ